MHGFWRLSLGGTVPTSEASCLIVSRIRAACHLPITILGRDPGLAIELASGRGPEIADGDIDYSVRDPQFFEDPLLEGEDPLVLRRRVARLHEAEHLDLV